MRWLILNENIGGVGIPDNNRFVSVKNLTSTRNKKTGN